MSKAHHYSVSVAWIGNRGAGTAHRTAYARDHIITAKDKAPIDGSSDPAFRGDPTRWNPEELLLASISACHKLWYLDLCARAGVVVISYRDDATATMNEEPGGGRFARAMLRPQVVIEAGCDVVRAEGLHRDAHGYCFIVNAVNFLITCEPTITAG